MFSKVSIVVYLYRRVRRGPTGLSADHIVRHPAALIVNLKNFRDRTCHPVRHPFERLGNNLGDAEEGQSVFQECLNRNLIRGIERKKMSIIEVIF